MEKLLTIKEVCDLLQVSRSTVYEWTHIQYIPHYKFPNGLRFKKSVLDNWIENKKVRGRSTYSINHHLL